MEKTSKDQNSIKTHLFSLLIPSEILNSFEIISVLEQEEEIIIDLLEKISCVPKSDFTLLQNGYLNPLELSSFPVAGKQCFLRLKRRRWKSKDDGLLRTFINEYDFTFKGTKATKDFGSFLKENSF